MTKEPKNKKTDEQKKRISELEDLLKRVQADFVNYRNRNEEARANILKLAGRDVILKVIPVLDHLDRAIKHTPKELLDNDWAKGFVNIKSIFENILKEEGLKVIESIGQSFDHELHEAISYVDSKEQEGKVVEEYEKGYMLNGQVIRPARVVVGRGKDN